MARIRDSVEHLQEDQTEIARDRTKAESILSKIWTQSSGFPQVYGCGMDASLRGRHIEMYGHQECRRLFGFNQMRRQISG